MTTAAPSFAKLIPGFDFLQSLVGNANAVIPGIGQWVAPTLDPAEIDKRIDELRTVQFWLEQNARMLATTIQALEVQRMTLATLKTMNVQVADFGDALRTGHGKHAVPAAPEAATTAADAHGGPPATAVVDPMQWWGALTRQFTELATQAVKDAGPAQQLAGQWVQQGLHAATPPVGGGGIAWPAVDTLAVRKPVSAKTGKGAAPRRRSPSGAAKTTATAARKPTAKRNAGR